MYKKERNICFLFWKIQLLNNSPYYFWVSGNEQLMMESGDKAKCFLMVPASTRKQKEGNRVSACSSRAYG